MPLVAGARPGPRETLRVRNAGGTGEAVRLVSSPEDRVPAAWSPDGQLIRCNGFNPQSRLDIPEGPASPPFVTVLVSWDRRPEP